MQKNYFPLVDLSRFSAALLVLVFHLGYSSWQSRSNGYLIHDGLYTIPQMSWAWFGYVGVQIFFVISGFVVTNSAANAPLPQFVIGRITRLYPTLWICATITLLVCISADLYSAKELARRYAGSLILFPKSPWMEGVYWTLVLELIFYALIGFMIFRGKIARIDLLAKALSIYSGTAILLVLAFHHSDLNWVNFIIKLVRDKRQLLAWYGVFFAMGIYFYLWSAGKLRRSGTMFALANLVLCCVQIYVGAALPSQEALAEFGKAEMAMRIPLEPVLAFLSFSAIIPLSIYYRDFIARNLSNRVVGWLRVMGLMSYPIYLLHFTLGLVLIRWMVLMDLSPLMALAISGGAIILLSYGIVQYLEIGLQRSTKDLLKRIYRVMSRNHSNI